METNIYKLILCFSTKISNSSFSILLAFEKRRETLLKFYGLTNQIFHVSCFPSLCGVLLQKEHDISTGAFQKLFSPIHEISGANVNVQSSETLRSFRYVVIPKQKQKIERNFSDKQTNHPAESKIHIRHVVLRQMCHQNRISSFHQTSKPIQKRRSMNACFFQR